MGQTRSASKFEIRAENIGGIDAASVTFEPGVTILTGQNATNRTSLLQAIIAALGGSNVSLKSDADGGRAELVTGDRTYSRTLRRSDGSISFGGDPYLEDAVEAELFGFLLENNEARRAVVQQTDLRTIIMRPVDTDEIEAEIGRRVEERKEVESKLSELDDLEPRLTKLEERRRELTEAIEQKQTELEDLQETIERADANLDETKSQKQRREEALDELKSKQTELESVRQQIASERESIEALREEKETVDEQLSDIEVPEENVDQLEREVETLRSQKRSIESNVSKLQRIIQFNDEMLDEAGELSDRLTGTQTPMDESGSVTDQLLEDTTTVCWTCGSVVESDRIAEMVDEIQSVHAELVSDRSDLSERIEELQGTKDRIRTRRRQRDRYEAKIGDIESEIQERTANLEDREAKREQLEAAIEKLEARVDELEDKEYEEVLARQRELTNLEFQLSSLEEERDGVTEEIAQIESRLEERSVLETRLDEVRTEVEDLRTRVEDLERRAVDAFNEQMETVLSILEYENIDRIWIERVRRNVREGRRKVETTAFELHIVRQTADGVSYEDTIDHLSESEREVTGLVFALAGYLVHDLHETFPFMLLDSIEAIDSDRIAALVDYFSQFVEYLVVALLPEDSAALSDDYRRVRDI